MIRITFLPLFLFLFISQQVNGQSEDVDTIKKFVQQSDIEMHVHFLAADEFRGRNTATTQLDIAGRYISTWFMTNNVKPLPGYSNYYQAIPFERLKAPHDGQLVLGDSSYVFAEDFIILNKPRGEFEGPLVDLEYGLGSELDTQDLEGKVVVVKAGAEGQTSPQQWFMSAREKNSELEERGAAAIIELYDSRQIPWQMLVNYLNQDRLEIIDSESSEYENLPHIWLNSTGRDLHSAFAEMDTSDAMIRISGEPAERVTSNNVVGYIEGTDPDFKSQYVLLSAHYDHVGVVQGQDEGNYIYNGARDNAVGISAVMLAARYLANNPPKRSVIFAAWTAEEIGLLGSNYFTENPMVSLDQIVYNLNIDGAGYNDTTKVTVIGLERTEAEDDLKASAEAFDLEAIPDPVPEQNLFDRSDNVNFARHGIPALTYSPGITAFDEEINKYYHTVEDEPHTVDYSYITRYIRSFLLATKKVANANEAPFWREDDEYEEAGLELYRRE